MKKVLSWVLTLALVLGSFSMAFAGDTPNSSKMSDANTIKNVEAVDVMIAAKIIGGYPDGSYKPEKDVTRAEMAKMISIAKNGGEDVGDYYKSSCTFADSVNHWAAGYIGYCANQGIIDGRSESVFDPNATVTGTEAAKMMLIALGYDSKIQGYTGSQWAAKVLKDAKENKLFDGCDNFKSDAALNRDNAAQIIFNGLNADTVAYEYDAEIKVGDTVVSVNTKSEKVEVDTPIPEGYNDDEFVQLYEEAFGGDLVKDTDRDNFGRSSVKWTFKDDEIGTYADEADFSFVVENANYEKALKAYDEDFFDDYYDVKATNPDGEWVLNDVYVNGAQIINDDNLLKDKEFVSEGMLSNIPLGAVVEFYDVTDEYENAGSDAARQAIVKEKKLDVYDVVISYYAMGKISKVKTNVTKKKDIKDGVSAYVSLSNSGTYRDIDIPGYNSKDYVEDAVIAVAMNPEKYTIADSFIPEMKTAEVTKVYGNGKSLLIDGEKIEVSNGVNAIVYAGYDKDSVGLLNGGTNSIDYGKDTVYDLYFVNGYIIGAVYADSEDANYGVVTKCKEVDDDQDEPVWTVTILTADGETVTYDVDEEKFESTYATLSEKAVKDTLIKYELNSDDEITGIEVAPVITCTSDITKTLKNTKFNSDVISEDVVVFAEKELLTSKKEYNVYGFKELVEDDTLTASYIVNDDEIVAMLVTKGLGEGTDVIGVWNGCEDGVVTLLVDGEPEEYEVNSKYTGSTPGDKGYLVVITVDDDDTVINIDELDLEYSFKVEKEFADGKDGRYWEIEVEEDIEDGIVDEEYDLSEAYIYYYDEDEDGYVLGDTEDIEVGDGILLYQIDEGSKAWNIAVIWSENAEQKEEKLKDLDE